MALLGAAALAMWWDLAPGMRGEFEDWHTHEHFPERMGVPGFLRGSRWAGAAGGAGFFVLYELQDYDVLSSPGYLARLNAPTPWSTRMMPHHANMVRSQCRVLESSGTAIAAQLLTVRLSPQPGRAADLRASLKALGARLAMQPGLAGVHLLMHETPPIAPTAEQQIRGNADRAADWILLATGYDVPAMSDLAGAEFGLDALARIGAAPQQTSGHYTLSVAATPADVRLSRQA